MLQERQSGDTGYLEAERGGACMPNDDTMQRLISLGAHFNLTTQNTHTHSLFSSLQTSSTGDAGQQQTVQHFQVIPDKGHAAPPPQCRRALHPTRPSCLFVFKEIPLFKECLRREHPPCPSRNTGTHCTHTQNQVETGRPDLGWSTGEDT